MWNRIVNPITGRKVAVNGTTGKKIIKYYLHILRGGSGIEDSLIDTPDCNNDADCLDPHNRCVEKKCMIVKCHGWPSKTKLATIPQIKKIIEEATNGSKLFILLQKERKNKFIIQAQTTKPTTLRKKQRLYDFSSAVPAASPDKTAVHQRPAPASSQTQTVRLRPSSKSELPAGDNLEPNRRLSSFTQEITFSSLRNF